MKKSIITLSLFAIAAPMLFTNCATILGKSSYPLSINANPAGAELSVTDKKGKEIYKGACPATVSFKSGAGFFSRAEYQVRISAKGYNEQIIPVNFKVNGWYFGNILLGGFLGMLIVDPATGAMWKMETLPINVSLTKQNALSMSPSLEIIDIHTISPEMRKSLIRVR